jgi:hypothetical protein
MQWMQRLLSRLDPAGRSDREHQALSPGTISAVAHQDGTNSLDGSLGS